MSLLEDMVASALQQALGAYVHGVDKKKLKLSVFSGLVELKNLPVRADALAAFQLPYKVKWGVIGTLRLRVSWHKLGKEPVDIEFDEVLVLLEPIKEWDQAEYRRMVRKAKEEQVQTAELIRQRDSVEHDGGGRGYLNRLTERVLDNLTFSCSNVHMRLEDDFTGMHSPLERSMA